MSVIPTPSGITFSTKTTAGLSDTTCVSGVYKFMGCSLLSANMTIGFNGIPSSLSVSLAEDTRNGDTFIQPNVPSLFGFSLPSGGVGTPIFFNSINLDASDFACSNVPFYFAGICSSWTKDTLNVGGRTISVNVVDPRELLCRVQCLLGGFALSQNIGDGNPRYVNINNVIDVFGFFNYGFDSGKNEHGIPWQNVLTAVESTSVLVDGIAFEFYFTGTAFTDPPSWYRINDQIIDIVSLAQKVATDGGSDLIIFARKVSSNAAIVEFRAIRRYNVDILAQSEISGFISSRDGIVESAKVGREFRNEAQASIVIGGMKNANYVAWPSSYVSGMHLNTSTEEDYNLFPTDIKVRLFGGTGTTYTAAGSGVTANSSSFDVDSGAIFPFWGFTPDDHAYPLVEPLLPLDHLVFDANSTIYGNIRDKVPLLNIQVENFTVRQVIHTDVFLSGDGDSDDRPFAYLHDYTFGSSIPTGYIRGLPLNTEVLRAALIGEDCFWSLYSLYYPDIAASLKIPYPDWKRFNQDIQNTATNMVAAGLTDIASDPELGINPKYISVSPYWNGLVDGSDFYNTMIGSANAFGKIVTSNIDFQNYINLEVASTSLSNFHSVIYQTTKQYALDHMGRKFLVCLPKSKIMEKIWAHQNVPTRPEQPQIEYNVDQKGYWTEVPAEFDGLTSLGGTVATGSPEDQIRRKFMAEDGRFYAMAVMDWKPTGNINFKSNAINRAMFQDLPVSEFRPNRIAETNPDFVCISCSISQLPKRPDLALVEIPGPVQFDPLDSLRSIVEQTQFFLSDEFLSKKGMIYQYLQHFMRLDTDLRSATQTIANFNGQSFQDTATILMKGWSNEIFQNYGNLWFNRAHNTENVMDLKAVIIPLTSTWVSYGPWYYNYTDVRGTTKIDIDESLVPWNFAIPSGLAWDTNLNLAGEEKLARSLATIDYLDVANIVVAGFPEYGLGSQLGFNSNITSISVDFAIGGVKTNYNLATYDARPGTYRKADYDDLSTARIDTRAQLPDPDNVNLWYDPGGYDGTNRFST